MLRIIDGEGGRAALAAVVETAEHALRLDSAYVRELARWASPPGSARRDGIPHTAHPARSERTLPHFPSRGFTHGHGWGASRSSLSAAPRSAGVICLLTTTDDSPVLRLGTAIQTAISVRRPPASVLFASGGEHLSNSHG
jgi:hypothetical protein